MRTDINNVLPENQPYNVAPWSYAGTETLTELGKDVNTVDWILVEFRSKIGELLDPGKVVELQVAGLLQSDGSVKLPPILVSDLPPTSDLYYVVVQHRTHITVASHVKVTFVGNTMTYDFSAQDSYIPGVGVGQKDIGGGVWVLQAGDVNTDKSVNSTDESAITAALGQNGYLNEDINMNATVDAADTAIVVANTGLIGRIEQ